jgi:acetyltransferase
MLDALFNPQAIAVIGASRDPGKVGRDILNNLIEFHCEGQLYPVNPSVSEILGLIDYSLFWGRFRKRGGVPST